MGDTSKTPIPRCPFQQPNQAKGLRDFTQISPFVFRQTFYKCSFPHLSLSKPFTIQQSKLSDMAGKSYLGIPNHTPTAKFSFNCIVDRKFQDLQRRGVSFQMEKQKQSHLPQVTCKTQTGVQLNLKDSHVRADTLLPPGQASLFLERFVKHGIGGYQKTNWLGQRKMWKLNGINQVVIVVVNYNESVN